MSQDVLPAPDGAASRIAELSGDLRRYEHEYYVLSAPTVSDAEYDSLYNELLELEGRYPELILPESPSQRIGSDLSSELPEYSHSIPVLSLDKAYQAGEIRQWLMRCAKGRDYRFHIMIEEKMDGSSLVLYYEKGILVRALSRGNGVTGNDITGNVRTIRSVPLRLSSPHDVAIRGEVFLALSDFDRIARISAEEGTEIANPRNFASGSLRRVKSRDVAKVPLRFFAYEPFGEGFGGSHKANLELMSEMGFLVNPRNLRVEIDPRDETGLENGLTDIMNYLEESARIRKSLDYEIDGMVLKIDEQEIREELGYTGHHPRWAIAYKFESPEGLTVVNDIDIQIGRTGRATPVARVEAVRVGGTTIQNVTLHNQDYIDSLGLGPGDQVAVSRRGDVIPAVERVTEKAEPPGHWAMPEICPECSFLLEKHGAHHFCMNFDCPARRRKRLEFFTGRDQMDIDNLGSETVLTLLDEGLISDIPDIFRLDYAKVAQLPGFAEKKAGLIQKGVEKARGNSYRRILVSLGLNELGPKVAELLEEAGFRSIDELFSVIDRGEEEKLIEIKGIGEKTIETISTQLKDSGFRELVSELKSLGLSFNTAEPDSDNPADALPAIFEGQRWCVTGSFETFKPRSVAMEEVKRRGGQVVSDVSSKTTHLLAGQSAGSKLTKAQKLGVIIIDESAFRALLSGGD